MKILHVVASLDPGAGGPALVAVRLAAAQAAVGHSVCILSYSNSGASIRIDQSTERVPGASLVHYEYLDNPTAGERILGWHAKNALRRLIKGADWVHCHGVWERLIFHAMEEAYRQRVPYCVRPAGMLDPWSLAQKSTKKSLALFFGYKRAVSRSAFVHALNADEARLLGALRLTSPIEIVPNGIFAEEVFPLPERGRFRRRYPALAQAPFILFLARLHYKKGLDILIPAFEALTSRYPQVCLVIAGPDDGDGARLAKAVATSPAGHKILIVGPLYGIDKFEALVDASIFCLPSRQEGFSVAVLEALAAGVPAVISEHVNFPEVGQVGAGAVVKLEIEEVADAIVRILEDSAQCKAMGEAAQRLVLERFTWPSVCDQIVACYAKHLTAAP